MEISREARARQALGRGGGPAAVTSAAGLPFRSVDAVEVRTPVADRTARSDRSERAARVDRERSEERVRADAEARAAQQQEPVVGSRAVLAVRIGVPPIGQSSAPQSDAVEQALRERAVLRRVGQVLSLPEAERRELERPSLRRAEGAGSGLGRASEGTSRRDGGETLASSSPEELVLGGSGTAAEAAPRPEPSRAPVPIRAGPARAAPDFAARDARAAAPAQPRERSSGASGAGEDERILALLGRASQGETEIREASATVIGGAGSGAIRDPSESPAARPVPILGDGSQAERAARYQIQRAATQFDVIEARTQDDLVSRFLGGDERPRDPGPQPRVPVPLEP